MSVCAYMLSVWVYVHMCVNAYLYVHICKFVCVFACIYGFIHVCGRVHGWMCAYMYMHVYVSVYECYLGMHMGAFVCTCALMVDVRGFCQHPYIRVQSSHILPSLLCLHAIKCIKC